MNRPLTGIPADKARSYETIEAVTVALRTKLGLEELDRFDALSFFEKQIGDMVLQNGGAEVRMVEVVDDCQQEGMTRWDAGENILEIVLAERSYEMLQQGHVRARSTVAHEAGHAILHTNQIIRLAGMSLRSHVAFHRDRNPHPPCRDTEWQANAFGSSLLMPAAGVKKLEERDGTLTARAIADTFGVSCQSAAYRIESFRRSLGL